MAVSPSPVRMSNVGYSSSETQAHGVEKVYSVRVAGADIPGAVDRLRGELQLEDGPAKAKRVRMVKDDGDRAILEITVTEGRKHLVRNLWPEGIMPSPM